LPQRSRFTPQFRRGGSCRIFGESKEQGFLESLPHFNSILNYLENPELKPILNDMLSVVQPMFQSMLRMILRQTLRASVHAVTNDGLTIRP